MIKLFVFMLLFSCSDVRSIEGIWINKSDPGSSVEFRGKKYYQYYRKDTIINVDYVRDNESCDFNYMDKTEKGDFIKLYDDDETCFEITGLTDSTLAYRYTTTGKLHEFIRKK